MSNIDKVSVNGTEYGIAGGSGGNIYEHQIIFGYSYGSGGSTYILYVYWTVFNNSSEPIDTFDKLLSIMEVDVYYYHNFNGYYCVLNTSLDLIQYIRKTSTNNIEISRLLLTKKNMGQSIYLNSSTFGLTVSDTVVAL